MAVVERDAAAGETGLKADLQRELAALPEREVPDGPVGGLVGLLAADVQDAGVRTVGVCRERRPLPAVAPVAARGSELGERGPVPQAVREVVLSLANKKKKKVLIASTSEVYGLSGDVPFREDGNLVMDTTARTFRYLDEEEIAAQRRGKAAGKKGAKK